MQARLRTSQYRGLSLFRVKWGLTSKRSLSGENGWAPSRRSRIPSSFRINSNSPLQVYSPIFTTLKNRLTSLLKCNMDISLQLTFKGFTICSRSSKGLSKRWVLTFRSRMFLTMLGRWAISLNWQWRWSRWSRTGTLTQCRSSLTQTRTRTSNKFFKMKYTGTQSSKIPLL